MSGMSDSVVLCTLADCAYIQYLAVFLDSARKTCGKTAIWVGDVGLCPRHRGILEGLVDRVVSVQTPSIFPKGAILRHAGREFRTRIWIDCDTLILSDVRPAAAGVKAVGVTPDFNDIQACAPGLYKDGRDHMADMERAAGVRCAYSTLPQGGFIVVKDDGHFVSEWCRIGEALAATGWLSPRRHWPLSDQLGLVFYRSLFPERVTLLPRRWNVPPESLGPLDFSRIGWENGAAVLHFTGGSRVLHTPLHEMWGRCYRDLRGEARKLKVPHGN
jgi:hypothetical protein